MAPSVSWVSNQTALDILLYNHFAYPPVLLVVFLAAFTWQSIATASQDSTVATSDTQKGPGGKPLPKTKASSAKDHLKKQTSDFSPARKLLFNWLSVFLLITFLGNAINVLSHALIKRKEGWWCGQSVAVSTRALEAAVEELSDDIH